MAIPRALVAAAGVAASGALCAFFLWPAGAPAAVGGALISRAAFLANPKLYLFHLLRRAGQHVAVAAFAA